MLSRTWQRMVTSVLQSGQRSDRLAKVLDVGHRKKSCGDHIKSVGQGGVATLVPLKRAACVDCLCSTRRPFQSHCYTSESSKTTTSEAEQAAKHRNITLHLNRPRNLDSNQNNQVIIEEKCQLQPYVARIIASKTPHLSIQPNKIDHVPIL